MKIVAFKEATMYEAQLGPLWLQVLRPRFWHRRAFFVTLGWDRDWRKS